ncbi:hypothetical protein VTH06DRAFT_1598 [Thermothelomyces fergusii]
MTDLLHVLPHFPVGQFARLIPVLEKHGLSTSDLLTLEAADIGKRTRLPLLDVKRLCKAVLDALHADLGVADPAPDAHGGPPRPEPGTEAGPQPDAPARPAPRSDAGRSAPAGSLRNSAASLSARWRTISTLDPELDRALGGGVPVGYVTEVTGESGAGKTQFLLSLLLSVQLPAPHGLGRPALYISTEAPLSTRRLAQMLSANPLFQRLPPSQRPSLDNIISTVTSDLESQDHILNFQVPVEVERRGIGLVVLDSVAANYRAEFERSATSSASAGRHGSNMGARTAELIKLGMHLRDLAQRHNLAVVVSNQVADRFSGGGSSAADFGTPASSLHHYHHRYPSLQSAARPIQESPLASRSRPLAPISISGNNNNSNSNSAALADIAPPSSVPLPSSSHPQSDEPEPPPPPPLPPTDPDRPHPSSHPALLLDHQQRWFTGWGDDPSSSHLALKTPALGLVWTTQLAARIALFRRPVPLRRRLPVHHHHHHDGYHGQAAGPSGSAVPMATAWERLMKVVFAPHVAATGPGLDGAVRFEVWMGGLRAAGAEIAAEKEDREEEEGEEEKEEEEEGGEGGEGGKYKDAEEEG